MFFFRSRYLAKSILNAKAVAESVFGSSANTQLLDPKNQPKKSIIVEDMPKVVSESLLNSKDPNIIYRCILFAQKLKEDPNFPVSVYCRKELHNFDHLPNCKHFLLKF